MASSLPTNALKNYIAQATAKNEPVEFDEIVFAYIQGLNDSNLSTVQTTPDPQMHVRHRAKIQQKGVINQDEVVYSVTLGSEIGNFTFNFVGLVNSKKDILGLACYTGNITKNKTINGEQGNALTRNIILKFQNAQSLTGITTSAKAWQFDFTDYFLKIPPKTITARTTNKADKNGHTHAIDKASTSQAGVVQLVDNYITNDSTKALTASAGKTLYDTLKALIERMQTNLQNAINSTNNALSTARNALQNSINNVQSNLDRAKNELSARITQAQNQANHGVQLAQQKSKAYGLWSGSSENVFVTPPDNTSGFYIIEYTVSAGAGLGGTQRTSTIYRDFTGYIGSDRYGGENADRDYASLISVNNENGGKRFVARRNGHEGRSPTIKRIIFIKLE